MCLEIMLPVVFIVGLVLAAQASDIAQNPATQFLQEGNGTFPANPPPVDFSSSIIENLCFNRSYLVSLTPGFAGESELLQLGLRACDDVPPSERVIPPYIPGVQRSCSRVEDLNEGSGGLPIAGLCVLGGRTTSFFIERALSTFTESIRVLDFDKMILLQWMVKITDMSGSSSSGSIFSKKILQNSGKLLFVPSSQPSTDHLVNYLNATFPLFKHVYGGSYPSRDAVLPVITSVGREGTTWAIIEVPKVNPQELDVRISMNRSATPYTRKSSIRTRFSGGLGATYKQFFNSGFLTLQATINRYYLRKIVAASSVGGSNLAYVSDPSTISPAPALSSAELEYLLELQEAAAANLEDDITLAPMGYPSYKSSEFLSIAGTLSPLVMVLSFLYTVSQLAKRLVEEKEFRLREGTMIMGLGKTAFFSSWYCIYIAQIVVTSLLVAIVLKAGLTTGSDWFLLFFLYLLFGISAIAMSGCLASCFNKSRITALVVPLLYFILAIPNFALGEGTSAGVYAILSLFSPVAFSVGTGLVFQYEVNNGMGWGDVGSPLDTPLNMVTVFAFLVIDIIIYLVLMVYFDMVLPKEWGTRSHPCFCFLWCCAKSQRDNDCQNELLQEQEYDNLVRKISGNSTASNRPVLWHQLKHLKRAANDVGENTINKEELKKVLARIEEYPFQKSFSSVHVKRVRKEFEITGPAPDGTESDSEEDNVPSLKKKVKRKPTKVAVNDVDLRFFPDMVTVLLGHNGAGKTTTMNMITGMMDTSKGDVIIYDKSVNRELTAARTEIGFCPQHNILWDQLTCMEHLQYFARLKGVAPEDVDNACVEMLSKVDLLDKRDVYSANLSGGQKRKLSVAIAFLGGSRLVLLDEPTAGMDVAARRHTWELIKEMTKDGTGRTVLLTTHFMDEADLLGSRIAIMSKGALHSYGSSMFLKQKLGAGYTMKISSDRNLFPDTDGPSILNDLQTKFRIPGSCIKECKGQELAIALPQQHTAQFPALIKYVESDPSLRQQYGIQGISMSVATLEDVFLAIAHEEETKADALKLKHPKVGSLEHASVEVEMKESDGHSLPPDLQLLSDCYKRLGQLAPRASADGSATAMAPPAFRAGFVRQLVGLLVKRLHYMKRDKRTIFLQVFMPVICILLAMALGELGPPSVDELEVGGPMMYDYSGRGRGGSSSDTIQEFAVSNCSDFIESFINTAAGNTPEDYEVITPFVGLQNTSFNFSNYLLDTAKSHGNRERYRGIACRDPRQSRALVDPILPSTRFPYTQGATKFNITQGTKLTTTLLANTSALYSVPEAANQYYQALARFLKFLIIVNGSSPVSASLFNSPEIVATFGERAPSVSTSAHPAEFAEATRISMKLFAQSLPYTERETVSIEAISKLLTALFVLIPFTFIPSTYVSFIVKERECKAKHLQFVSGVNYFAYWLANFIFDLVSFQLTAILAIIIFAAFDRTEYIGSSEQGGATYTVILLYGISGIAWAYGVSFLFDNHSNAQNIVMLANFMCGFVLVLTLFILGNISSTADAADSLVFLFRFIPSFCLGEGFLNLAIESASRDIRSSSGLEPERSLFAWDVIGYDLLYMGIESVVFSVLVVFWDNPKRKGVPSLTSCWGQRDNATKLKSIATETAYANSPDENQSVAQERSVVEKYFGHQGAKMMSNGGDESRATDVVRVVGLRKVFTVPTSKSHKSTSVTGETVEITTREKVAVKNLTFGVKNGEIFGFLGTNGAGKTTTMSILTGEFPPTSGKATVGGYDVITQSSEAQQVTGYCPQFDAVLDLLTPAEHLYLYASLRGIPTAETAAMVAALTRACGLEEFKSVPSSQLSGGNKRKLSVALALIGTPRIVFLDEPSAGMDPHARRQMWDVILFIASHCSVILTTHHLEEVDVLAHRAGIMVDGELKCLGSLEALKREFGGGFELWIKVSDAVEVVDSSGNERLLTAAEAEVRTEALIQENFPSAKIVEKRQGRFTFSIPFGSTSLSNVFDVIQKATSKSIMGGVATTSANWYGITDYTVQQASLEQVFMRISNAGALEDDASSTGSPLDDDLSPPHTSANMKVVQEDELESPMLPVKDAPPTQLTPTASSHSNASYEAEDLDL